MITPTLGSCRLRTPRQTSGRGLRAVAVLFLFLVGLPDQSVAQDTDRWDAPRWVGDLTFVSLSSISGGVSAGLFSKLRGGSFKDAFAAGMVGGAVHYGGMRLAAEKFSGAGLLGRQLSTTGASMTRNASEGRPPFKRLWFAAGPLHLYVDLGDEVTITPKVSLPSVASLVYLTAKPEIEFDLGSTISAGVPVVRSPGKSIRTGDGTKSGVFILGTIIIGEVSPERREIVFAHERVHALQADWDLQAWSHPMENEILSRIPGGEPFHRYVDLNLIARGLKLTGYSALGIDDRDRLYEQEAYFLDE